MSIMRASWIQDRPKILFPPDLTVKGMSLAAEYNTIAATSSAV
jgi:hypothetical protein